MTRHRGVVSGSVLAGALLIAASAWAQVDPVDINPLADTLGSILAVPFARLFAGLLAIVACFAFLRQNGGVGVVLAILVGMILIGPAIIRIILSRVLITGGTGG